MMSDFLKQFSDDVYKSEELTLLDPFVVPADEEMSEDEGNYEWQDSGDELSDDELLESESIHEQEEYLQAQLVAPVPAPMPASNPRQKIASTAHEVKKNIGFDRRKITKYSVVAACVVALSALAFGIFFTINQVEVKDFVGNQAAEARTWGIQNRISIDTREVYSNEVDSGVVISQSREPEIRISRGSVISLEVSKGPDMTERIEIPDFVTMTTEQVRQWRQEAVALNANINEEYSAEVEQHALIRYEFTDPSVSAASYTRADGLLIYMSRGPQVFEANITVPDFLSKPVAEVQEWAREQGIELEVTEAAHASVEQGLVSAQSVAAGTKLARGDVLTTTVSLGPAIIVPNFANISFEHAAEYQRGLEITIRRQYSTRHNFGALISQSIPPATELTGDGHAITLVYSLGRPYIENLMGQSEHTIAEYFYGFTSQGANISYQIWYVDSHLPKGTIVWMSHYAQWLRLNDHVIIDVSRGNKVAPEGFEGGE